MENMSALRASISFPPELYRTLEKLAQQKKVSLAWIVRDAAERYVNALKEKEISESLSNQDKTNKS